MTKLTMGTLCIYLNFKLIWPISANPRGGGWLKGRSIQEVTYEEGGGAIFCFVYANLFCMVEQCVVLMSSKIFLKMVQLGKLWCIFLSDFGINNF